mgnify:CR=1 FL=1
MLSPTIGPPVKQVIMTLGQVKQAVKGVSFDIIPKYNKVNSAGTIIQDNLGSLTENKLFYCFFSNISSLSKHAQEYLLSLPHESAHCNRREPQRYRIRGI